VARERIEVRVEILNIDRKMRDRLRAVDEHRDPARMRECDHPLDRVDRAERIRHVHDAHEFRARVEELLVGVEKELAGVVDRNDADDAPFSSASICHGTMFEWCSRVVRMISSPAPMNLRP
jgi:hypothetical protein